MSTSAPHSPLNISETVRDKGLIPKNQEMAYGKSNDRWRHVTPKAQVVSDPNMLKAQYLENSWRCYFDNNR